jgi:death-on-curing protein
VKINYVSIGDVMAIVAKNGWHPRDALALNSTVEMAQAHLYGVELYPGLHAKAAAMLNSVNRQHPLLDGNKRLSWLLVTIFYGLNGYEVQAPVDEAERLVLDVAVGLLEVEQIAAWLAEHTAPPGQPSVARKAALDDLAGKYTGVYPEGYLDDLRNEWPD